MNSMISVQINWNYLVATSLKELNLEQERLYNQSYRPLYNYRLGEVDIYLGCDY